MQLLPEYTQTRIDSDMLPDEQYFYDRDNEIVKNNPYPISPMFFLLAEQMKRRYDPNYEYIITPPTMFEKFKYKWNILLDKLKFEDID